MKRSSVAAVSPPWQDLIPLAPWEKARELALSPPWLILSFCFYAHGLWWAGAFCSFYFFLTGLRQSHQAQHYALGLPRWMQDGVLFILSLAMLASMHAIQATHLRHHQACLRADDVEGATARGSAWAALAQGPLFIFRLHQAALRLANRTKRRWILFELGCVGIWLFAGFFLLPFPGLQCHLAAMLVGECLTGFFAVWTVHRDCHPTNELGRTLRNPLLNALTCQMFLHAEHHLFPAVPTPHLPELAKRLDAVNAHFAQHQVFSIPPSRRPPPGNSLIDPADFQTASKCK